jgi:sortase A
MVVEGTDHETLKKGPGHYQPSGLPGAGHLIYVAGHRTTYLAPFADINDIQVGDYVTFTVPYGTFTYRVRRHYVVPSERLAVLRDGGREVLRLQACHPRFFATHRYIVDAALVSVAPRGARAYTPSHLAAAAATGAAS